MVSFKKKTIQKGGTHLTFDPCPNLPSKKRPWSGLGRLELSLQVREPAHGGGVRLALEADATRKPNPRGGLRVPLRGEPVLGGC